MPPTARVSQLSYLPAYTRRHSPKTKPCGSHRLQSISNLPYLYACRTCPAVSQNRSHSQRLAQKQHRKKKISREERDKNTHPFLRMRARDAEAELNLPPGFRFHPTDEELVVHYLCRKVTYQALPVPIIAEVDLYKYDPWQLPGKALFGQKEWYFFTPRDRKYPNGSRPNRAAGNGYWKATGADKPIKPAGSARTAGIKKALVFYSGKAPKGVKTNWIMHEYRLADPVHSVHKKGSLRLDDWVLCRLYNKKNGFEKVVLKTEASTPLREAEDSFDTMEAAGSDSFKNPESDIENDSFTEVNKIVRHVPSHPSQLLGMKATRDVNASFQTVENSTEDNDWLMGFTLEEMQNSFGVFGEMPVSDLMFQDYSFPWLSSPRVKPGQTSLLPF
ncbi:hypothetical protein ACLOJK_004104 [Asimina triloba]